MREVLFRGQTRRKGEKVWMDGSPVESNWVYGGIFQGPNRSVIYGYDPIEKHVVYSDTVGQFTGLTDKNGTKIFEDDVVAYCWYDAPMNFRIDYVSGEFLAVPAEKREDVWALRISGQGESLEVIGNIHDNPELLEVANA